MKMSFREGLAGHDELARGTNAMKVTIEATIRGK
jgi:hypothetical protein